MTNIALLKITQRHDSRNVYYLRVDEKRQVWLTNPGLAPLSLTYLSTAKSDAAELRWALESVDSNEEAVKVCEKLLMRYVSGDDAGKPFYDIEIVEPRRALDGRKKVGAA